MSGVDPAASPSPFKGLAPFDDSPLDALLFFGREREIEVIAANLVANRLTVLYGPSGVGKTSLLRAGVAQRLRADPEALVVVFASWAGNPVPDLLETAGGSGSLADGLAQVARRDGRHVYVVLDQFEEYFLYHERERGPGTLMDELSEALRRRGLRANFLVGIREDALARLDAFKNSIPNLFANTLRLDRLDRRAGEAAILGPVREHNRLRTPREQVEVETELCEAVLGEVAAGRVDLGLAGRGGLEEEPGEARIEAPFLQLVLERLWEVETARGSRVLRLETLRELGGAARIVGDHLERAMSDLSAAEKDAAAAMYNHLVTPSGTKIAHRAGDLAGYAGVQRADADRVLGRLVHERIVRAGEDGAAGPRYEIFHDVLADAVLAWRTRHEADRRLEAERAAAQRRQRRTLVFAIVAAATVAVLAVVSLYALLQRSTAREEARHARARELATLSSLRLADDPERSLRLALQANSVESSPQTEDVLRTALRRLRVKAILRGGGPVAAAAFSPDGTLVVTAGGGEARVFRTDSGAMVRQLAQGAPVTAAAVSPDGSLIVTGARDGVARIWSMRGASLHELAHDGPVTSVTFAADGRVLATTSEDGTARIWDVAGGRLLYTLRHPHAVKSASFSHDGRLLVTALVDSVRDRVARIFDVRGGRLVRQLVQPKQERVTVARFAPSGELVVTGSGRDSARVWDGRTGKLRLTLEGHKSAVLDAEFSPDGDRIVTASADQTARIWDAKTGDLITPLSRHMNHVVRVHFSPDGRSVVTASDDRLAIVFDAFSGTVLAELIGHEETVVDAVFSPDGATVVSASPDGTARLWDALPQPPLTPLGRHGAWSTILSLAFSPDGKLVATAGEDGEIRIWRYGGGLLWRVAMGTDATHVEFSRDGSLLLGASTDGDARVWRTETGASVRTFRHQSGVVAAALSPDARLAATAEFFGPVRVWELASGRLVRKVDAHGVRSLSFSPDGRLLVTGGPDDSVASLWRPADGALLHELAGHDGGIVTASFSPDGGRLVTASEDKTARIWSTATGALEHELRGHRRPLTAASFSPDGRLVATTSLDGESRLWLVGSGGQSVAPMRQAGAVNGAAFSADGRWLVTAGPSAGVWEVRSGDALFLLRPRESFAAMSAAAFSPSGLRIAVAVAPVPAYPDGTVRTFDCRLCAGVDQLVAIAQSRLARLGTAG